MTRLGLVVKIERFSLQIGNENGSRRQNWSFLNQKRWREPGSSSKKSFSHRKMVTRMGLVAKIGAFSTENGDENRPRRQNWAFFDPNWWREQASSSKLSISSLKLATRFRLVAKIGAFSTENGDENRARRQNKTFFAQNWRREDDVTSLQKILSAFSKSAFQKYKDSLAFITWSKTFIIHTFIILSYFWKNNAFI
jgi:hypothetical protein